MVFNRYRRRLNIYGDTIQNETLIRERENFEEVLYDSPNYFKLDMFYDGATKVDCTIQDVSFNSDKVSDDHILCTTYDSPLKISDLIIWEGDVWLVAKEEVNTIKTHKTFIIGKCNHILKFYNRYGKLVEIPCVATNKTLWTLGIKDNVSSAIATGDNKLNVALPKNEFTKTIRRDFRLICDEKAWKVASFDTLSGYLSTMCSEEQIKTGLDDMVNEIPYNNYEPIIIKSLQTIYKMKINDITEVKAEVRQGVELLNESYIITSSDETIVKVLENNQIQALSVGQVDLTLSLINNPNIFVNVQCVVEDVAMPIEETFSLTSNTGVFTIKKANTVTFTPKKFSGIIEILALWDFEIDYGEMPMSNISISETTDTHIKIKGMNNSGTFTLRATERNTTNIVEQVITLKPIY